MTQAIGHLKLIGGGLAFIGLVAVAYTSEPPLSTTLAWLILGAVVAAYALWAFRLMSEETERFRTSIRNDMAEMKRQTALLHKKIDDISPRQ